MNVFAIAALGADYAWGWRLSMLLLSTALAALIYHGIEGPVRRWLERSRPNITLQFYAGALAGAVAISVFVVRTDGVPSRYPDRVVKLASYTRDSPPPLRECEYSGGAGLQTQTMCRLGAIGAAPRWFVYGDSHAWAASGAIDQWLTRTGQSALFMFLHGCPPVRGVFVFSSGSACFLFNAAALAYLNDQPTITQVLLISTWRQAKEGILTDAADRKLTPDESIELFDRQFAITLDELKRKGKSVYIWEPLPGARSSVPQAMARSELKSVPLAIDFSRDEYLAEYAFFFAAVNRERQAIAGTFSPLQELCHSGRCITQIGGVPLYFDNGHLSYSLRSFWADALARQMPHQP